MKRPLHPHLAALTAALCCTGPATVRADDATLRAAYAEALESVPRPHPSALEMRDAVKAFTDVHHDARAVAMLQRAVRQQDEEVLGRGGTTAALVALALLAPRHDTAAFLKACLDKPQQFVARDVLVAVSFLPAEQARRIAWDGATAADASWSQRAAYLPLLRAVGDEETLRRLEELPRDGVSGAELAARDRAIRILRARLSLPDEAEQRRWARPELVFFQVTTWGPNFRSIRGCLRWSAAKIHEAEPEFAVELLRLMLRPEPVVREAGIWHLGGEVSVGALLAALQQRRELLPLLDEWAQTDLGFVSGTCREAAEQLRAPRRP